MLTYRFKFTAKIVYWWFFIIKFLMIIIKRLEAVVKMDLKLVNHATMYSLYR